MLRTWTGRTGGFLNSVSVEVNVIYSCLSYRDEDLDYSVMEDLASWLGAIKMDQYLKMFTESGYITPKDVLYLTNEDLESLGVGILGHRKKLLKAIRNTRLQVLFFIKKLWKNVRLIIIIPDQSESNFLPMSMTYHYLGKRRDYPIVGVRMIIIINRMMLLLVTFFDYVQDTAIFTGNLAYRSILEIRLISKCHLGDKHLLLNTRCRINQVIGE